MGLIVFYLVMSGTAALAAIAGWVTVKRWGPGSPQHIASMIGSILLGAIASLAASSTVF